ncbi:MAG: hypothetical protein ACK5UY_09155 [Holosporales bacterium]
MNTTNSALQMVSALSALNDVFTSYPSSSLPSQQPLENNLASAFNLTSS